MEWLFANPQAAAAAEAAAAANQTAADDEQLAAMVAEALSVEGGAVPLQAEAETPTAAMPDTPALVDGAVRLLEAAPFAAFYACDLLKAHSTQSPKHRQARRGLGQRRAAAPLLVCLLAQALPGLGKSISVGLLGHLPAATTNPDRILALLAPHPQAVLERLMWHLGSASSPTDTQLFAPAHLAAVLLSEVGPSREVAAEKGFASIALDAVDAWASAHLPPGPTAVPAPPSGKPGKPGRGGKDAGGTSAAAMAAASAAAAVPVPRWVDTLLLALDILASTPPKPPPAPAPAGGAAGGGLMEALQQRVEQVERLLGLRGAGEAGEAATGGAGDGAGDGGAAQPPANAAAPGGDAATNATVAGQQQGEAAAVAGGMGRTPSVTSPAGAAPMGDAGAVGAAAQGHAAEGQSAGQQQAASGEQQAEAAAAAEPELSQEERVMQALAGAVRQYSTGGALSQQEQARTVELCLRLLKHLHSWGAAWTADEPPQAPTPPEGTPPATAAAMAVAVAAAARGRELLRPDPRSTLHATVQLLARLTKDHGLAEKVRGSWQLQFGCLGSVSAARWDAARAKHYCDSNLPPCLPDLPWPNPTQPKPPIHPTAGAGGARPRGAAGAAARRLQARAGAFHGRSLPPHSGGPSHASGRYYVPVVCPSCRPGLALAALAGWIWPQSCCPTLVVDNQPRHPPSQPTPPHAQQAAMEAEIRSTLAERARTSSTSLYARMPGELELRRAGRPPLAGLRVLPGQGWQAVCSHVRL